MNILKKKCVIAAFEELRRSIKLPFGVANFGIDLKVLALKIHLFGIL